MGIYRIVIVGVWLLGTGMLQACNQPWNKVRMVEMHSASIPVLSSFQRRFCQQTTNSLATATSVFWPQTSLTGTRQRQQRTSGDPFPSRDKLEKRILRPTRQPPCFSARQSQISPAPQLHPDIPNGDVASTSSRRGVGSETCPLTRTGLDIRSVGYCTHFLTNVRSHFHEPAHFERITAPAQAKISLSVPKSTLRSVGGSRVTTGSNFNDSILPTAMDFSVDAKHIFPFFPRRSSLWRTPIHAKIVEILVLTTLRASYSPQVHWHTMAEPIPRLHDIGKHWSTPTATYGKYHKFEFSCV